MIDPAAAPQAQVTARKRGIMLLGIAIVAVALPLVSAGLFLFFRDKDEDGLRDGADCAPENPAIAHTLLEDEDCDGTISTDDCSPKEASDTKKRSSDEDCDGLVDADDCDPKGHVDDLDCDNIANEEDCAATNSNIYTRKANDADCDGLEDMDDCNTSDPNITTRREWDADCDGVEDDKDCVPASPLLKFDKSVVGDCRGPLLEEGMLAVQAPSVPDGFEDRNPMSGLIAPNAFADSTEISAADRQELGSKAKQTLWVAKASCSLTLNDTLAKLMVDCGEKIGTGYYVNGLPVTKRTVECEPGEAFSCGECSSSDDCKPGVWPFGGCLLGCEQSRCVWGRCTACPAERICDDPEFNDTSVSAFAFSTALSEEDLALAEKGLSGDVFVAFRAVSASRQVFTGKPDEDGEVKIEHDSGYRIKVNPVFVAYTNGTRWVGLKGGPTLAGTLTLEGSPHTVKCSVDKCTVSP